MNTEQNENNIHGINVNDSVNYMSMAQIDDLFSICNKIARKLGYDSIDDLHETYKALGVEVSMVTNTDIGDGVGLNISYASSFLYYVDAVRGGNYYDFLKMLNALFDNKTHRIELNGTNLNLINCLSDTIEYANKLMQHPMNLNIFINHKPKKVTCNEI